MRIETPLVTRPVMLLGSAKTKGTPQIETCNISKFSLPCFVAL